VSGLIPLEGGVNFRDIGGYQGLHGTIMRGRVFRSGLLTRLTEADRTTLSALGIRLICDFRGPEEQGKDPISWLPTGARLANWGTSSCGDITLLRKRVGPEATVAEAREAMIDLYRSLPHENADRYGIALEALALGQVPAVLACTAGKDRTGTMVALLMSLLGTPREAVVENYAQSDKHVDYVGQFRDRAAAAERAGELDNPYLGLVKRVSAPVLETLLASHPDYILAGLVGIEAEFGSIEAFAAGRLGVTAQRLAALRQQLLE